MIVGRPGNPKYGNPKPICYMSTYNTGCESNSNGGFTPEQDNDKTTRHKLNLCIPMMPSHQFVGTGVKGVVLSLSCRCLVVVLSLSCRCLVVGLLWCENTLTVYVVTVYMHT